MKRDKPAKWRLLGAVAPEKLRDARLQAHYAGQFIASFAAAYMTRREDLGHLGMSWSQGQRAFVSGVALGPRRIRMALDLPRFEIFAMEPVGTQGILERLNLKGVTLEDAAKWMRKAVARFGFDPEVMRFDIEGMPDHPLRQGEGFSFDGGEEEMEELGRYFSNADHLLAQVCSVLGECSSAQVWPGSFDISANHSFIGRLGNQGSIGMGLMPGDDYLEEPYFFVNAFPKPSHESLASQPPLGRWRNDQWTGVTLAASQITAMTNAEAQQELALRFFTTGVQLLKSL